MRVGSGIQDKPIMLSFHLRWYTKAEEAMKDATFVSPAYFKKWTMPTSLKVHPCYNKLLHVLEVFESHCERNQDQDTSISINNVFGIACGARHLYHTSSFYCCRNAKKYYEKKPDADTDDTNPPGTGRVPKTEKGEKVKKDKTKTKDKKSKKRQNK